MEFLEFPQHFQAFNQLGKSGRVYAIVWWIHAKWWSFIYWGQDSHHAWWPSEECPGRCWWKWTNQATLTPPGTEEYQPSQTHLQDLTSWGSASVWGLQPAWQLRLPESHWLVHTRKTMNCADVWLWNIVSCKQARTAIFEDGVLNTRNYNITRMNSNLCTKWRVPFSPPHHSP